MRWSTDGKLLDSHDVGYERTDNTAQFFTVNSVLRQISHRVDGAWRGGRSWAAIYVLLALQGCVSMAPSSTCAQTASVPVTWSISDISSVASATSLAQWWSRFTDPLLDTLVEQALLNNTDVESAQAALRQARALRDVPTAGLLPVVGSSGSVQQGTSGGHSTGATFNAGFDANVPIALCWPARDHHKIALKWFSSAREAGWSSCAFT